MPVSFDVPKISLPPLTSEKTQFRSAIKETQRKTVDPRIRLIENGMLPIVANLYENDRWFVFDDEHNVNLPRLKTDSIDNRSTYKKNEKSADVEMSDGLTLVGNPMELSMLDISNERERLDCRVNANGCNPFVEKIEMGPYTIADGQNLLLDVVSGSFRQRLADIVETKSLNEFNLLILTDGSDASRCVCYGNRVTKDGEFEINIKYLGFFGGSAMNQIGLSIRRTHLNLRNVCYHGSYEALSEPFAVPIFSQWLVPPGLAAFLSSEEDPNREAQFYKELVRGSFKIDVRWKESDHLINEFNMKCKIQKENLSREQLDSIPFKYFQAPNTMGDASLTISPGWLDPRIKNFDRSLKLRFIKTMFMKSMEGKVEWPTNEIQVPLIDAFKTSFQASLNMEIGEFDVFEGSWDYFAAARSYGTLREMMTFILDLIKNEQIKPCHIHSDNFSSFTVSIAKSFNMVRTRLDESRIVEYVIQLGMDRIRRELLIELGDKKGEVEKYLDYGDLDVDDALQKLLTVHLALQAYDLCRKRVDNSVFVNKLFGTLLCSYEQVGFHNMSDFVIEVKTSVSSLNRELFNINHLREWSVNCDFNDFTHGSSQVYVYLSRNQELRVAKEMAECQYREHRYACEVPDISSFFHTYFVFVKNKSLVGYVNMKQPVVIKKQN